MPGVPVDLAVIASIQDLLDGLGLPAEALRFEAIDGAAIHCSETLCVIVGHDERQTDLKRRYESPAATQSAPLMATQTAPPGQW